MTEVGENLYQLINTVKIIQNILVGGKQTNKTGSIRTGRTRHGIMWQ
jgi:hypothetical protein